MVRRKKEVKQIDMHVRLREDFKKAIEEEAQRLGISFNVVLHNELEKAKKFTLSKYKGLDFIYHMPLSFTCYECLKKKPRFDPAWYDTQTGATLCTDCGDKHDLSPHVNVKADRKLRKQKKLSKDYDVVINERFEILEAVERAIEDGQIQIKNVKTLEELKALVLRILGSGVPKDWEGAFQDLLKWLEENRRLQAMIIEKKEKQYDPTEKELYEKLMNEKKKRKKEHPYVS